MLILSRIKREPLSFYHFACPAKVADFRHTSTTINEEIQRIF